MDTEKLFRLLRQSEMHAETLTLQLRVAKLQSQITQNAIRDYERTVAEAEGIAMAHQGLLDQTRAAMLAMLEDEPE